MRNPRERKTASSREVELQVWVWKVEGRGERWKLSGREGTTNEIQMAAEGISVWAWGTRTRLSGPVGAKIHEFGILNGRQIHVGTMDFGDSSRNPRMSDRGVVCWISAGRAEGSQGEGVDPERHDFAMENRGKGRLGSQIWEIVRT